MKRSFKKTGLAAAALATPALIAPALFAAESLPSVGSGVWGAPAGETRAAEEPSMIERAEASLAAFGAETANQPWTGPYVGLSVGYAAGWSEHYYNRAGHGTAETSPSGGAFALTAGYNWQWESGLVLGVEGDLGIMALEDDAKVIFDDHTYKTEWGDWYATLRARGGYAVDEDLLLYGTMGVGFVDSDEVVVGNTPQEGVSHEGTMTAFVGGLGVEHRVFEDVSVKAEWMHFSFAEDDGVNIGPGGDPEDWRFDGGADLFRVGVNLAL